MGQYNQYRSIFTLSGNAGFESFFGWRHTKTQAQVWSIEGAVESGRRAAKAIDSRVVVLDQYRPRWIRIATKLDDWLYAIRAPQIIDLFLWLLLISSVGLFYVSVSH